VSGRFVIWGGCDLLKFEIGRLDEVLGALAGEMSVFAPVCGAAAGFAAWTPGVAVDFDRKTAMSAKGLFLPQYEDLYVAGVGADGIEIAAAPLVDAPFVVFGARGCDIAAISVLDAVYLKEPVDRFYQARRENAVIIGLACGEPDNTCFCKPFAIDAAEPGGDISVWVIDGWVYWRGITEKGIFTTTNITNKCEWMALVEDDAVESYQREIRGKIAGLANSKLPLGGFMPDRLLELFDSPAWDELYRGCLACGACTYACPTCQCYDIADFAGGGCQRRHRTWDSCMYSDFTLMAHGNIRHTQKERFRQRFMHKLIYHLENFGHFGCVGCGRCAACPAGLSIVRIIKTLGVDSHV